MVVLLFIGWLLNTPGGVLGKADAVGYALCHRIDERSYHLGGRALPLCVRCTGMYLGAMLGLAYQALLGRRRGQMPSRWVWGVLGVLVLAFGLDGVNSYAHLIPGLLPFEVYEPQNWLRLLTGTGMGLAIAVALFPSFNQTVWADWEDRPVLEGWRAWGGLFGLAVLFDLLVLTESPIILFPLAIASAATALLVLTMVYAMVWLILLRRENCFTHLSRLLPYLVGGFALALAQIIVLDAARYWLTGTWAGFSFD